MLVSHLDCHIGIPNDLPTASLGPFSTELSKVFKKVRSVPRLLGALRVPTEALYDLPYTPYLSHLISSPLSPILAHQPPSLWILNIVSICLPQGLCTCFSHCPVFLLQIYSCLPASSLVRMPPSQRTYLPPVSNCKPSSGHTLSPPLLWHPSLTQATIHLLVWLNEHLRTIEWKPWKGRI